LPCCHCSGNGPFVGFCTLPRFAPVLAPQRSNDFDVIIIRQRGQRETALQLQLSPVPSAIEHEEPWRSLIALPAPAS
jgi:hypothetical protein